MTGINPPRRPGRSILVVLAGALVGVALSIGTDALLQKTGVYPPGHQNPRDSLLLLATAYRTLYGILGSYITARPAPDRPMGHALVLGAMGTFMGVIGLVVTWGRGPAVGYEWYPTVLAALAMPQSWLAGKLRLLQLGSASNPAPPRAARG
jgi:hypothetical protein